MRIHSAHLWWAGLVIFFLLLPSQAVPAQGETPNGAYYVVQEGDTLWDIAARFNLALEDLEQANALIESSQISPGDRLLLPGVEGFTGPVDSLPVPVGETLQSLSRRAHVPPTVLARMNRLTAPSELYVGRPLILLADRTPFPLMGRALITPGLTLLEVAARSASNPWSLVEINQLAGSWAATPGDVLLLHPTGTSGPGALPADIHALQIEPQVVAQGKTVLVEAEAPPGLRLEGSLAGRELRFFPWEQGYAALTGIHAFQEPGLYPLSLHYTAPRKEGGAPFSFSFTQSILIQDANFPFDPVLIVDPQTIDPAVTGPEDDLWSALAVPVTPEKRWQGPFLSPVPREFEQCWTSMFGNRRSYNGSAYLYFHSGLDFCGGVGTQLFAPAAGEVVFAGPLAVRGQATVIDHGWGVYTAYDHQSEILVEVGDFVQPGQLIGLGGATGRVTGPHLHWEVWVGGVQVDPIDWLNRAFP